MSFLLRAKSHSAEGREIVRASRVEGDRLLIGRDPACHVHLTDLAAALRHATVERNGGRLLVTAEPGLRVELNGRNARSGRIDLATGGDLRIASHLLRFMPTPPGADEIAVEVERAAEGGDKLDRDEARLFSLAGRLPSKRLAAWALTILVAGLFLVWPIRAVSERQERTDNAASFHPDSAWSSGKLSQAHAQLEDNCGACHVKAFEAVTDASCQACHTTVHDHADPFRLARARPDLDRWGKVKLAFQEGFGIPPGRCVECHTEHEGAQRMPVTAQ